MGLASETFLRAEAKPSQCKLARNMCSPGLDGAVPGPGPGGNPSPTLTVPRRM